jgi:predicted Zn-dependent peptidase
VAPLPDVEFQGRHLTLTKEGQDQVHTRLGFAALAVHDPRVPVLLVLNRLLGDGASSRLFQRLREEEGVTYDVWSSPVLRFVGGLLEVGWACAPDQFEDAWRSVLEVVEGVGRDLRADEVEIAREGLVRGLRMDAESPSGWASLDISEFLELGRRFDPERTVNELGAVTVDQVRELAAEILRRQRMASAICGPEGIASGVA